MTVIKIKNKDALDKLQAKLTLRLGRKITQQETLDYCVMLADQNFEKLIQLISKMPILNQDRVKKIIEQRNKLKDVPYNVEAEFINQEDKDIYTC